MKERIAIITAGGTIDKVYGNGKRVRDLHIGPSFAVPFLKQMLGTFVDIDNPSEMHKDSIDMTDDDRTWIVAECKRADTMRIIITQGTDTMIKTARAIYDSGIAGVRTIVLTGALQPACMRNNDAEFNLGMAAVACLTLPTGIYIAMNGIHKWSQCYKDTETGRFISC